MHLNNFKMLLWFSIVSILICSCNPMRDTCSYMPLLWPESARNREIAYAILANPDTLYNFSYSSYTCFIGLDSNGNKRPHKRIENFLKPFFKGENEIIADLYFLDKSGKNHHIQFKNKITGEKVKFDFLKDTSTNKWDIYWISAMNIGDFPDYEVDY